MEVKKLSRVKIPEGAFYGTGKRKSAIAKVWVFPKKEAGFYINSQSLEVYFPSEIFRSALKAPFSALGLSLEDYAVVITVFGGGLSGQSQACLLGITRALIACNNLFRPTLKARGYVSRDPRVKERKKYGRKKARKGFQFRKR